MTVITAGDADAAVAGAPDAGLGPDKGSLANPQW